MNDQDDKKATEAERAGPVEPLAHGEDEQGERGYPGEKQRQHGVAGRRDLRLGPAQPGDGLIDRGRVGGRGR